MLVKLVEVKNYGDFVGVQLEKNGKEINITWDGQCLTFESTNAGTAKLVAINDVTIGTSANGCIEIV